MLNLSKYKVLFTYCVACLSTFIVLFGLRHHIPLIQGMKLGLDLKGGAYLTLAADQKVLYSDYSKQVHSEITDTLSSLKINYSSLYQSKDSFFIKFDNSTKFQSFKKELLSQNDKLVISKSKSTIVVSLSDQDLALRRRAILEQSVEVLRRRIDQFGTNEPIIRISGDNIIVEIAGIKDLSEVKKVLGKTARLSFNMVDAKSTFLGASLPYGYRYVQGEEPGKTSIGNDESSVKTNTARYAISLDNVVTGEHLKNAKLSFNKQNQPVVAFTFDNYGAKKFAKYTSQNIGKFMAIVLDNTVISAPKINSAIIGGQGIIEGNFTLSGAQDLALLLKAGSLPVPLKIIEDRTIGPSLGQASIKSGLYSLVFGIFLVFVFMILFYRKLGVLADLSLIFNTFLTFACLYVIGGTLTLPGIAGIILGTGMAVDSNILVYERYNYELKYSRPSVAMSNAFNRVYQTLLDSNVTTLFATSFLFFFGTGPVKGFAVTLIIGILTSMFSIFFTTRVFVHWFYLRPIQKNNRGNSLALKRRK